MILKTMGTDISEQARAGDYIGTPYEKLDCQGFVEQVLKDLGVRKPDGTPYNWRGSNSMYRNFVLWRGTIDECKSIYGHVPEGVFTFIVKHDGGEKEKGYRDDLGNASHVGIYIGNDKCMDSQPTGGVQIRPLKIFTNICFMSMVDYGTQSAPNPETDVETLHAVRLIREGTCSDSEYFKALEYLTKVLMEV